MAAWGRLPSRDSTRSRHYGRLPGVVRWPRAGQRTGLEGRKRANRHRRAPRSRRQARRAPRCRRRSPARAPAHRPAHRWRHRRLLMGTMTPKHLGPRPFPRISCQDRRAKDKPGNGILERSISYFFWHTTSPLRGGGLMVAPRWADLYAWQVERESRTLLFRQIYLQMRAAILSQTLRVTRALATGDARFEGSPRKTPDHLLRRVYRLGPSRAPL